MKVFSICTAMAIFAALSHAAPAEAETRARSQYVEVRFEGAPPDKAFYTRYFPTDGTFVYIDDPLSVSHIILSGDANCYFYGTDGSFTNVKAYQTQDVGPPQTQYGGYCVEH